MPVVEIYCGTISRGQEFSGEVYSYSPIQEQHYEQIQLSGGRLQRVLLVIKPGGRIRMEIPDEFVRVLAGRVRVTIPAGEALRRSMRGDRAFRVLE